MPLSARARRTVSAALLLGLAAVATQPVYAHDPGVGVVRYNADGSLDQSFGNHGIVSERTPQGGLDPEGLAIERDGKILLAGTSSNLITATIGFGLERYNGDGSLDTTFGSGGRVLTLASAGEADAHAVAVQPDGSILVAGSAFADVGGESQFALARYTPDGTLDATFGSNGWVLTSVGDSGGEARSVAVQQDGRIVLVGTSFGTADHDDAFAVARYLPDGRLDQSFGRGGIAITELATPGPARGSAVLVEQDGTIVAAGSAGGHDGSLALVRYTPSGTASATITRLQASAQGYALAVQLDGRLLVAGGVGSADSQAFSLTCYTPDGTLDPSFGSAGTVITSFDGGGSGAHGVAVQPDGKIVLVGSGNGDFAAARLNPDGSPDTSFGGGGGGKLVTMVSDAGSFPAAVALQPDGKIVSVGLTYFYVPPPDTGPPWWQIAAGLVAGLVLVAGTGALVWRRTRRPGSAQMGSKPN